MKTWSEAQIAALLNRNQYAVYRALVVLDEEGVLPSSGREMAGCVVHWQANSAAIRRVTHPLGSKQLDAARRIVLSLVWRLTEMANSEDR